MEITSARMEDNSILLTTENFVQSIPIRGRQVILEEDAPGLQRLQSPTNEYTFRVRPNQVRIDFGQFEVPALGRAGFEQPRALIATSVESVQWFTKTLSDLVMLHAMKQAANSMIGA